MDVSTKGNKHLKYCITFMYTLPEIKCTNVNYLVIFGAFIFFYNVISASSPNKSNITGLISYRGWDTNIETVTVKAVMGAI